MLSHLEIYFWAVTTTCASGGTGGGPDSNKSVNSGLGSSNTAVKVMELSFYPMASVVKPISYNH